jgi:hypothetical protein
METVTLSVNTINNLLNYLGNKPYVEVVHLIMSVQQEIAQRSEAQKADEAQPEA